MPDNAEKAHHEGRRAFLSGKYYSENPYDKYAKYDSVDTRPYRNWENGWNFAEWKETTKCSVQNVA